MSAETEIIDGVDYRNVWQKDDPAVARDAREFGARVPQPSRPLAPDFWSKGLCVVAYANGELVGLAPGEIRYSERVKANMAFLRVFVAPEHRQRGIVIPMAMKFHEIMREYSLENPEKRIG